MPSRSKTNMRLSTAVQRYLDRIRNEKQSDASQYTARYALARFERAVGTTKDPDPWVHLITPTDVEEYFYGARGISVGVKGVTLNRYRSVLIQFFRYCADLRFTDLSPMASIRPAQRDAPVNRLRLSATELVLLMEKTSNPVERVGCSLGMNTGLRGNDVRHLTVFDANLNSGWLQSEIRKIKRLDEKPITMELEEELIRWLDIYAEITGFASRHDLPNDYLLMPSYRLQAPRETLPHGIQVRPLQVHTKPWHLVQRPLRKLGYPSKGEGFHTLRRSSARALFEKLRVGEGRDHALMIVRDFLNHASTTQTEVYLGLSHERVLRDSLLRGKSFLPELASSEHQAHTEGVQRIGHQVNDVLRQASGS